MSRELTENKHNAVSLCPEPPFILSLTKWMAGWFRNCGINRAHHQICVGFDNVVCQIVLLMDWAWDSLYTLLVEWSSRVLYVMKTTWCHTEVDYLICSLSSQYLQMSDDGYFSPKSDKFQLNWSYLSTLHSLYARNSVYSQFFVESVTEQLSPNREMGQMIRYGHQSQ